ncbi:MAG: rod shape-determining protein, partial [Caldilineaceae bacterium]|nr:rod shape-determining protein [Caldilineaceae bacterium]
MVVDMGGGTTEAAVVSMYDIVTWSSVRVGGNRFDESIINYVRKKYNLLIGERMAERTKIEIGSAYPMERERTMILRGRNLVTGLPEAVEVSSVEIREALSGSVEVIVDSVKGTLDETPPELVADLMEYGIVLAGGGALLQGLAQRLQDETRMHVYVADNPLTAVVMGTGMILEKPEFYRETLTTMQRKTTIR